MCLGVEALGRSVWNPSSPLHAKTDFNKAELTMRDSVLRLGACKKAMQADISGRARHRCPMALGAQWWTGSTCSLKIAGYSKASKSCRRLKDCRAVPRKDISMPAGQLKEASTGWMSSVARTE